MTTEKRSFLRPQGLTLTSPRRLPQVGRILGHTQPSNTYRCVNANAEVRSRAADILHEMQVAAEPVNDEPRGARELTSPS